MPLLPWHIMQRPLQLLIMLNNNSSNNIVCLPIMDIRIIRPFTTITHIMAIMVIMPRMRHS